MLLPIRRAAVAYFFFRHAAAAAASCAMPCCHTRHAMIFERRQRAATLAIDYIFTRDILPARHASLCLIERCLPLRLPTPFCGSVRVVLMAEPLRDDACRYARACAMPHHHTMRC